jgi:phenylacetate-CoA ligase
MSKLRMRTPDGEMWPAVPAPMAVPVWSLYQQLEQTQWWPAEYLQQGQLVQLRRLLLHCEHHVPYYRALFAAHGISASSIKTLDDVRRIPLLTRATVHNQAAALRAEKLPSGQSHIGGIKTSGTSGMPVEVAQTDVLQRWWLAFQLRGLAWADIEPRGTLAIIRALGAAAPAAQQGVALPFWSDALHALIETGPAHVMDIHQDPRVQLEWLLRVQPHVILSYPSNVGILAALLVESGRKFERLQAIQLISETLPPELRTRIESAFGAPIVDTYSCNEAGTLASPCPSGGGFHVHSENVLFELLDDDDQPCKPGETGRVVFTTLHNFASPFVRYEILDGATWADTPCGCKRGLPLLSRVLGRRRPPFVLPDGRRKDSGFISRFLVELRAHHQHQIVQLRRDHVEVRVVPGPAWAPAHVDAIVQAVRGYFESDITVDVKSVARIEITPGGKFREVTVLVDDV